MNTADLITAQQLKALYALTTAVGWTRKELSELTILMFQMIPAGLTRDQATALIEHLGAVLYTLTPPS